MPAKFAKRKAALSKPGTGQFAAGALSGADTRTQKTSVAPPVETRFVQLESGKTGTLINAPITDLSQQTPAFAEKLKQAQTASPSGLDFSGKQLPPTSPFLPPTTPLSQILTPPPQEPPTTETGGKTPQTSIFGARTDQLATAVLNKGFDFVQSLGNGDFARGLASLVTLPLTAGAPLTLGKVSMTGALARSSPGIITKESLQTGGVKASNTIKNLITKAFKPTNAVSSIKSVLGIGGLIWLTVSIIKDSTSTGAIGVRDINEEAGGMVSMFSRDMKKAGDEVAYQEFRSLWEDLKNTKTSWMPFGIGAVKNTDKFVNATDRAFAILDAHDARMGELAAEGISPEQTANFWEQYHARVEANKTSEEKLRVDYFNSERLRVEGEIARARKDASKAETAQRKKEAEETAAFWLEYHKQLIKMQEEEREEQAAFWLAYRKMVLKLQDDSGRSRLGFGLLR